jgi:sedoheptulose-bisphosphatase
MDVQVDTMIYDYLRESPHVAMAISEERPYPTYFNKKTGSYNVCFDPIDGSNILESNYAVGSIFGIWPAG